ncbi:hypothetical protein O7602_13065 [Micromonospora sp. WMMD1128]|uniref:hypothetical protein n=1 Tax=Micromonospora sp. WMMD1128 TaxID=3015150 RepID=UPI00248D002E|nr:hypothetical protein [Micromonospora sp. WMMD1128]WBB76399.1 hypothetical protein O7602_13065 [Micromonospora sp. WMMD1128]
MSGVNTERAEDRPAEVTDPLLWDLSAAVADAHQPDATRRCASPSCAGAAWPCAAWDTAQVGLSAARTPNTATAPPHTAPRSGARPAADGDGPGTTSAPVTGEDRLVATAA